VVGPSSSFKTLDDIQDEVTHRVNASRCIDTKQSELAIPLPCH
jgi:hypothetical protein